jgi:flagellar P-ring protein FlgI
MTRLLILLLLFVPASLAAQVSVRVKDIATYRNTAGNHFVGEGLVFGLNGTGDPRDPKTQEMLRAISSQLNPGRVGEFSSRNVARVHVSVTVNAFAGTAGARVTCRVSVADNSKSLEGGTLFPTALRFAFDARDEREYVTAQGALQLEYDNRKPLTPGVGEVTGEVVRDIPVRFFDVREDDFGNRTQVMTLILAHPNSSTAVEVARRINESPALHGMAGMVAAGGGAAMHTPVARAVNDGVIEVRIPARWHGNEMEFKEIVDTTAVSPDIVAQVHVNQRTGVLAFTGNVRVLPGAFTVRGVTVNIGAEGDMQGPQPGENLDDPTVPLREPGPELQQLIDTFNLLRLSAEEKAAVVRALERNGMLQARVIYE